MADKVRERGRKGGEGKGSKELYMEWRWEE